VIEVLLASALLCFEGACHPVLVGKGTPTGEFQLQHQATRLPGYGGDILTFKETAHERYAIHRTWRGRERLYKAPAAHRTVTNGCINVEPALYERLVGATTVRIR
jgi:hypothetical protein